MPMGSPTDPNPIFEPITRFIFSAMNPEYLKKTRIRRFSATDSINTVFPFQLPLFSEIFRARNQFKKVERIKMVIQTGSPQA
jgi:hypothetical protein